MSDIVWRRPGTSSASYNNLVEAINALNRSSVQTSQVGPPVIIPIKSAEISDISGTEPRILCQEIGSTAPTPEQFDVYLPLVYIETSRTYSDGTVTYVYTDKNTRTASGPQGPNETQYLEPPLIVGEPILTIWNDSYADYMMVPDGRMWVVPSP